MKLKCEIGFCGGKEVEASKKRPIDICEGCIEELRKKRTRASGERKLRT